MIAKKWPDIYAQWFDDPKNTVFPQGEAFWQTQRRVLTWWQEAKKYSGNTLVVTHDNIVRIIIADTLGFDLNNIWQFHLQPAAISIVEILNNKPVLTGLNDTGHLAGLQAILSTHAL